MATVRDPGTEWLTPPKPVDRYFSLYFGPGMAPCLETLKTTGPGHGEDICVARHHNGICVLCLSPSHPIVTQKHKVSSVSFREGLGQVKGKRKRGGTFLERDTRVASIVCVDGTSYVVNAGVRGVLVETNAELEHEPSLVTSQPLADGFLAVILPKHKDRTSSCEHLLACDPCKPT